MATIAISNLIGSDLFVDRESFLHDLSDSELTSNLGGTSDPVVTMPVIATIATITITAQVVYNNYVAHREAVRCEEANRGGRR